MDALTMLVIITVIGIGIAKNMLWLSIIGGLVLIGYIWGTRPQNQEETAPSGGPKVKPIVVKRKYTGPDSIYPSRMDVKTKPEWGAIATWRNAAIGASTLAKTFLKALGIKKEK